MGTMYHVLGILCLAAIGRYRQPDSHILNKGEEKVYHLTVNEAGKGWSGKQKLSIASTKSRLLSPHSFHPFTSSNTQWDRQIPRLAKAESEIDLPRALNSALAFAECSAECMGWLREQMAQRGLFCILFQLKEKVYSLAGNEAGKPWSGNQKTSNASTKSRLLSSFCFHPFASSNTQWDRQIPRLAKAGSQIDLPGALNSALAFAECSAECMGWLREQMAQRGLFCILFQLKEKVYSLAGNEAGKGWSGSENASNASTKSCFLAPLYFHTFAGSNTQLDRQIPRLAKSRSQTDLPRALNSALAFAECSTECMGWLREQMVQRGLFCVLFQLKEKVYSLAGNEAGKLWSGSQKASFTSFKIPTIPNHESEKRAKLLSIAKAEIGVRELSNHNDGAKVESYLHVVQLQKGDPWCAAFISWVFAKAGYASPRTGWSPALFTKSTRTATIKAGNVLGIWFPNLKRIAHVGLVEAQQGDWLLSIEGNTNVASSREGDGVYRKRRLLKSIYAYADWLPKEGGEK